MNVMFGLCYGLCTYYYYCSMLFDPGYVPKLPGMIQQKAVVDELLKTRKYDEENFCMTCMIRKPIRSKHCKRCARCIAKHDQ
jgi:palmitoyltransferase ZDHHC13/17